MTPDALNQALGAQGLFVMGLLAEGDGTRVLVGGGPGMWPRFQAAPEARDGAPDPLDRWSKRILHEVAEICGATGLAFPSDGPPYPPFLAWAQASNRFWSSPVGMLVHDTAGLMVSIRGALVLPDVAASVPPARTCPCDTCSAPCRTSCPVDALKGETYDVTSCKDHLRTPQGSDCMDLGCRARRACPISQAFDRDPAQSAFHMRAFLWA